MTQDEHDKIDKAFLAVAYPEEYAEREEYDGSDEEKRYAFDDGVVACREILHRYIDKE